MFRKKRAPPLELSVIVNFIIPWDLMNAFSLRDSSLSKAEHTDQTQAGSGMQIFMPRNLKMGTTESTCRVGQQHSW